MTSETVTPYYARLRYGIFSSPPLSLATSVRGQFGTEPELPEFRQSPIGNGGETDISLFGCNEDGEWCMIAPVIGLTGKELGPLWAATEMSIEEPRTHRHFQTLAIFGISSFRSKEAALALVNCTRGRGLRINIPRLRIVAHLAQDTTEPTLEPQLPPPGPSFPGEFNGKPETVTEQVWVCLREGERLVWDTFRAKPWVLTPLISKEQDSPSSMRLPYLASTIERLANPTQEDEEDTLEFPAEEPSDRTTPAQSTLGDTSTTGGTPEGYLWDGDESSSIQAVRYEDFERAQEIADRVPRSPVEHVEGLGIMGLLQDGADPEVYYVPLAGYEDFVSNVQTGEMFRKVKTSEREPAEDYGTYWTTFDRVPACLKACLPSSASDCLNRALGSPGPLLTRGTEKKFFPLADEPLPKSFANPTDPFEPDHMGYNLASNAIEVVIEPLTDTIWIKQAIKFVP